MKLHVCGWYEVPSKLSLKLALGEAMAVAMIFYENYKNKKKIK